MTTPGVSVTWKCGQEHGLALAAEVKLVARQSPQMYLRFQGAFQLTQVAALVAVIERMGEEYLQLWQNSDEITRKVHEAERKLAAAETDKQRYLEERDALQRENERLENESLYDRFGQPSYKEMQRTLQQQQARIQQLTEGMAKLLKDIKDE